jgi:hypothetical protein
MRKKHRKSKSVVRGVNPKIYAKRSSANVLSAKPANLAQPKGEGESA